MCVCVCAFSPLIKCLTTLHFIFTQSQSRGVAGKEKGRKGGLRDMDECGEFVI